MKSCPGPVIQYTTSVKKVKLEWKKTGQTFTRFSKCFDRNAQACKDLYSLALTFQGRFYEFQSGCASFDLFANITFSSTFLKANPMDNVILKN